MRNLSPIIPSTILGLLFLSRQFITIKAIDLNEDLIKAAYRGDKETLLTLLSAGADINAVDSIGWTALMRSARKGHLEVVLLLLQKGAVFDKGDHSDRTALHLACGSNKLDVSTALIEWGANINAVSNKGCTPLHVAALWCHKEAVVILLDNGAEINSLTVSGKTALDLAIEGNDTDLVEILSTAPIRCEARVKRMNVKLTQLRKKYVVMQGVIEKHEEERQKCVFLNRNVVLELEADRKSFTEDVTTHIVERLKNLMMEFGNRDAHIISEITNHNQILQKRLEELETEKQNQIHVLETRLKEMELEKAYRPIDENINSEENKMTNNEVIE